MVDEVKIMLGESVTSFTDEQIGLHLKMALQFVEDYTGRPIDYSLNLIAERIAVLTLNRTNTEGLTSMSMNGVTESYLSDLPADIKVSLDRKRKVRFV